MNTAATYKCPKCNGSGYLSHYSGIANGVCFSCEGNGFKFGAASPPGVLFPVSAVRLSDGERVTVFHIKASSEAAAVAKAIKTLARGNGYAPTSAQIA